MNFSGWSIVLSHITLQICLIIVQGHCFSEYTCGITKESQENPCFVKTYGAHLSESAFRQAQLMICSQHRELYSNSVLLSILLPGPCVQILINCIIIRYINGQFHLPLGIAAVYMPISLVLCLTYVVLIDFLSKVYEESKNFDKEIIASNLSKYIRSFIRSCPVLRVNVGGGGNFIELMTSLKVPQFSIVQLISLLLLDL